MNKNNETAAVFQDLQYELYNTVNFIFLPMDPSWVVPIDTSGH